MRVFALTMLLAVPAFATTGFPDALMKKLQLKALPATSCTAKGECCPLCHQNNDQTIKATVTPFVLALKSNGLVAYDTQSLNDAVDALDAAMTDSDGDGIADITELRNGTNPNGDSNVPNPYYGCGAQAVPGLFMAAAALLLAGLRRK